MQIGELKLLLASRTCVRLEDESQKTFESIHAIPDALDALVVWSLTAEDDMIVMHVREQGSIAALQLHGFQFDQGM